MQMIAILVLCCSSQQQQQQQQQRQQPDVDHPEYETVSTIRGNAFLYSQLAHRNADYYNVA